MLDNDVKGTLLIANEGINGTISGTRQGIDNVLEYLRSIEAIGSFTFKESYTDAQPFYRTKVKLKKEIVTMGVENIDPLQSVGRYVKPSEWNALISDPDVILIDTRNDYEVKIGTFQMPSIQIPKRSASSQNTSQKRWIQPNIKKSRCSVLVVYAVRSRLLICVSKALKRCII